MAQNCNFKHLFLNSNPWYSAVSDYSYQLCLYLYRSDNILYCAEIGSTVMDEKCKQIGVTFRNLPIHNQTIKNIFYSFFRLFFIIWANRKLLQFIWVFEGREHTLCCILKLLFPFLFRKIKIIRVRGQSQKVRNNIFSKLVYNVITDKIVLAAECVKNRFNFQLNKDKYLIHYYCKNTLVSDKKISTYFLSENLPGVNSEKLNFLLIGRFDKVKGHEYLINAYLNAKIKIPSQLILLGYKANLNPSELYTNQLPNFGSGKTSKDIFFLESEKENKQVFIVERKINNIHELLSVVSFGVIPSLDSEVICRVGVEFLQSSIPVIYSSAGALREVFKEFPEFNFSANDQEELKKKLEMASELFQDKAKFELLRNNATLIGESKYKLENFYQVIDFINSK